MQGNDFHAELAWLRTIFDAMEDALFVHDLEGRILDCNSAACVRMGYTREEFLRMRTRDFDSPEFAQGFASRLEQQLAHKRHRCEGVHLAKNGTPIHVDIHTTLIEYRGKPAVLAVMRDITERKLAENEREALRTRIAQSEKMESLGVMAGGIAHDFNNLLMGVLGNASIAMAEVPEGSRARRCLEQIESAAQRAANLSQQMLAYSGRASYTFKHIDLGKLVRDAAPSLTMSIANRHFIDYRIDADGPVIHADASQLRQVLLGLVANASEAYGDGDGVVVVSVRTERITHAKPMPGRVMGHITDGEYAVIEVKDSGCGMEERIIERIFDPFFTTKFTGRGLGLAAVIGIVRGHHGAISVESSVGAGSVFCVYLPLASPVTVPAHGQQAPRRPTGQAVLVVDDEEAVLNVGQQALERAGHEVFVASSGQQAIELFRQRHADIGLVVLDMTMPRLSGEETYRALKEINPDVRIVVSSGFSKADAAFRFGPDAVEGFLQKPYRARDLVALVNSLFRDPDESEKQTTEFHT